jgi:hypothetical protein
VARMTSRYSSRLLRIEMLRGESQIEAPLETF